MDKVMTELEPCPFCKGAIKPRIHKAVPGTLISETYSIGGHARGCIINEYFTKIHWHSLSEMIKDWNTRNTPRYEYRLTWCTPCNKALVTHKGRCDCGELLKEYPTSLIRYPQQLDHLRLNKNNYSEWIKDYCSEYWDKLEVNLKPNLFNSDEILETYEGMTPVEAINEDACSCR